MVEKHSVVIVIFAIKFFQQKLFSFLLLVCVTSARPHAAIAILLGPRAVAAASGANQSVFTSFYCFCCSLCPLRPL